MSKKTKIIISVVFIIMVATIVVVVPKPNDVSAEESQDRETVSLYGSIVKWGWSYSLEVHYGGLTYDNSSNVKIVFIFSLSDGFGKGTTSTELTYIEGMNIVFAGATLNNVTATETSISYVLSDYKRDV